MYQIITLAHLNPLKHKNKLTPESLALGLLTQLVIRNLGQGYELICNSSKRDQRLLMQPCRFETLEMAIKACSLKKDNKELQVIIKLHNNTGVVSEIIKPTQPNTPLTLIPIKEKNSGLAYQKKANAAQFDIAFIVIMQVLQKTNIHIGKADKIRYTRLQGHLSIPDLRCKLATVEEESHKSMRACAIM